MHGLGARSGVPVAAALLLAACSGSSTPASTTAGGGGATSAPGVTAQSGGGGNGSVTGMKACSLLSTAEIQAALGSAMKDGVEQDTDNQVDCEWDSQADGGPSMGLIVKTYDDTLWQTMSSSQLATPISGFGDAAYAGYPHKTSRSRSRATRSTSGSSTSRIRSRRSMQPISPSRSSCFRVSERSRRAEHCCTPTSSSCPRSTPCRSPSSGRPWRPSPCERARSSRRLPDSSSCSGSCGGRCSARSSRSRPSPRRTA